MTERNQSVQRFASAAVLTLMAAVVASYGFPWLREGIELMMTPMWGYNDSGAATYLAFGIPVSLIGLALVWAATVFAALAVRAWLGLDVSNRRLIRTASGFLLAVVALAFLGISISFAINEPETGNALSLVGPYVLGTSLSAAVFAVSAVYLLKPAIQALGSRPGTHS